MADLTCAVSGCSAALGTFQSACIGDLRDGCLALWVTTDPEDVPDYPQFVEESRRG